MAVFNSLGSNYTLGSALRVLFGLGDYLDQDDLRSWVEENYDGKAYLFYKGREALSAGIKSLNLAPDSKVAINGYTCFAVDEAVTAAGLSTVYLDIEKDDYNFSFHRFKAAVEKDQTIRAVIIQHTYGRPIEQQQLKAFRDFCDKNHIFLIEDLAHAFGASYADGTKLGTIGDLVMLSFGRDKVVDAVSGGVLIDRTLHNHYAKHPARQTKASFLVQLVDRLYPLNTWFIRRTFDIKVGQVWQVVLSKIGLLPRAVNWSAARRTKLPNWQARIILRGIRNLEGNLDHRQQIADIYQQKLGLSVDPTNNKSTNLRLSFQTKERAKLLDKLKQEQIYLADVWYDSPIAPPRFLADTHYSAGMCPVSDQLTERVLNLPTHININVATANKIADIINHHER